MHSRALVWLALAAPALAFSLVARPARAWTELHESAAEGHMQVDARGRAAVTYQTTWRIVHGPITSITIGGFDPEAELDASASVQTDDGRTVSGHVARAKGNAVEVSFDTPHGLGRGVVKVELRWQTDLMAAGQLVADDGAWRLVWRLPASSNGLDLPKMTLTLPPAPTPAKVLDGDVLGSGQGATWLATNRDEKDSDVVELVKPYLSKGEAASGALRVSPHVFSAAAPAAVAARPVSMIAPVAAPPCWRAPQWVLAIVLAGAAFAGLVAAHERRFQAWCSPHGLRARGLIPMPGALRSAAAGLCFSGAMAALAAGAAWVGGALLSAATLSAALGCPPRAPSATGAGRWLPLRPHDAFGREEGGESGLLVVAWWLLPAVVGLLVWTLCERRGLTVAIACAPFVPLGVTGRLSQRPTVARPLAARLLARPYASLRRLPAMRVVPWARLLKGADVDELRLRAWPRVAVPGTLGVELGHGWTRTSVGWVATPQVLVRFTEGSSAAAKLSQGFPHARSLAGRSDRERVLRMYPRRGSRASAALVRRMVEHLTDRRSSVAAAVAPAIERRAQLGRIADAAGASGLSVDEALGTAC
jgi:hypothetical protein